MPEWSYLRYLHPWISGESHWRCRYTYTLLCFGSDNRPTPLLTLDYAVSRLSSPKMRYIVAAYATFYISWLCYVNVDTISAASLYDCWHCCNIQGELIWILCNISFLRAKIVKILQLKIKEKTIATCDEKSKQIFVTYGCVYCMISLINDWF